jgi:uncharacterized protein
MKTSSYLIKPASSLCNLQCKYCFYHDVSDQREVKSTGLMNETTMKALIMKACENDQDASITFAFQGGEPTLVGLAYFKNFIEMVSQFKKPNHQIHYAIQTNGTLLDDAWFSFLKENEFLVGISLDGFQSNHDLNRLGRDTQGTFKLVMKSIEELRKHQIDFNILTVLTAQLAKEPERLYQFYKQHDFRYIQLIPCLPRLKGQSDEFALSPQLFASFYKAFYELWLIDFNKQDYISISLFDNVIPMYKGHRPMQCGMLGYCSPQYVIEADGSVYPCDFYALDDYVCGNINTHSLKEILESPAMNRFLNEKKPMCSLCDSCRFVNICHGNCKRLNVTYFDENYCGYQEFLEFAYPSMIEIAQKLKPIYSPL